MENAAVAFYAYVSSVGKGIYTFDPQLEGIGRKGKTPQGEALGEPAVTWSIAGF